MKYNKRKLSFSLIELMFCITILVVLSVLITGAISKKTVKVLSEAIGGEYTCYKDSSNRLHQRTVLNFVNATIPRIDDRVVNQCEFQIPQGTRNSTVILVGGGGSGGGLPYVEGGTFNPNNLVRTSHSSRNVALTRICNDVFYYNTNGAYADCYIDNSGSGKKEEGYIGTAAGRRACITSENTYPIANENIPLPTAPSRFNNELDGILSDAVYTQTILSRMKFNLAGGDYARKTYDPPSAPTLEGNYLCYSGNRARQITTADKSSDVFVSPTPGIIQINDRVKVIKGANWIAGLTGSRYRHTYGAPETAAITTPVNNAVVEQDQITSIQLPHATNGRAGATQEIHNLNLGGQTIRIAANDVGNGGVYNGLARAAGVTGGRTRITLNGRVYTANGGSAGTMVLTNVTNNLRGIIDATDANNVSKFYLTSNYTEPAPWSDYTNDYMTAGAINVDMLRNRPGTCNAEIQRCFAGNTPTDEMFSFGAGGSGANSLLEYNKIKSLTIRAGAENILTVNNNIRIQVPEQTRNGLGGAIIIKWGTQIN